MANNRDIRRDDSQESRITALEENLRGLGPQLTDLRLQVGRLADRINDAGRTNWNTIFSAVGLAVLIIGSLGSAWVAPIAKDVGYLQANDLESKAHRTDIDRRLRENEHLDGARYAKMKEQFREIETQFDWATDVSRLSRASIEQILGILWEKVHGTSLPGSRIAESGPMGRGDKLDNPNGLD